MAQKYLEKINKASTAEYRNRRKIRLMILIITVAAALFEVSDFGMKSYKENGAIVFAPRFTGFFGLFLMFVAAGFGAFAVYGVFSDLTNKQTADVQLSLPMSAKDRYYSKLLAASDTHRLCKCVRDDNWLRERQCRIGRYIPVPVQDTLHNTCRSSVR